MRSSKPTTKVTDPARTTPEGALKKLIETVKVGIDMLIVESSKNGQEALLDRVMEAIGEDEDTLDPNDESISDYLFIVESNRNRLRQELRNSIKKLRVEIQGENNG